MKKLLVITIVSLVFYFNPIIFNKAKSWGTDPLEKCMNRVIKGTFNGDENLAAGAAKLCAGANKGTDKCMNRVIKGTYKGNENLAAAAAKVCLGN